MARGDAAWWKPVTRHCNVGFMKPPIRGQVSDRSDGHGDAGVGRSEGDSPRKSNSARLCLGEQGETWRFMDASGHAWAGDEGSNEARWTSAENVGRHREKLTEAELAPCGLVLELTEATSAGG